jgi:hypothetical protein
VIVNPISHHPEVLAVVRTKVEPSATFNKLGGALAVKRLMPVFADVAAAKKLNDLLGSRDQAARSKLSAASANGVISMAPAQPAQAPPRQLRAMPPQPLSRGATMWMCGHSVLHRFMNALEARTRTPSVICYRNHGSRSPS